MMRRAFGSLSGTHTSALPSTRPAACVSAPSYQRYALDSVMSRPRPKPTRRDLSISNLRGNASVRSSPVVEEHSGIQASQDSSAWTIYNKTLSMARGVLRCLGTFHLNSNPQYEPVTRESAHDIYRERSDQVRSEMDRLRGELWDLEGSLDGITQRRAQISEERKYLFAQYSLNEQQKRESSQMLDAPTSALFLQHTNRIRKSLAGPVRTTVNLASSRGGMTLNHGTLLNELTAAVHKAHVGQPLEYVQAHTRMQSLACAWEEENTKRPTLASEWMCERVEDLQDGFVSLGPQSVTLTVDELSRAEPSENPTWALLFPPFGGIQ